MSEPRDNAGNTGFVRDETHVWPAGKAQAEAAFDRLSTFLRFVAFEHGYSAVALGDDLIALHDYGAALEQQLAERGD